MSDKKDEEFIPTSKVLGQGKVVGPFTIWQLIPLVLVLLLVYLLHLFKFSFRNSLIIGVWILTSLSLVTGKRPDRLIRRWLGRPKRWRRGFRPSSPLLEKQVRVKK